ncbi:MAG TPA: hypothetical protein VLT62_19260 [Candidatus Methylomirabilis sp.]|nr:hypothetical protein [Candidatus Methylomirabilis sp.]
MKTLLAASLAATVLAASMAFAIELPVSQPIKGPEGPDVRLHAEGRPVIGGEGPIAR